MKAIWNKPRPINPALKYPIDSVRAELVEAPSRAPFDKLRANVIVSRVNNTPYPQDCDPW
ncbi:hypothetical protein sS8_5172 [Methylocaldum marinum]|uniref:Uncharacterized protein n=1 Tax=Methylocaldum marinum TaxID=1432792 RepID=A0A250L023_9GAMM|nr:hypothetical protein sS8_5172 [Methylocaldum marinum]